MQTPVGLKRFRVLLRMAIVSIFLVIFAGALVRATGSGMGCPDWPFCYGLLIPPVSASQLPPGYEQTFAVAGHPAHFDATQTWIEYTNRLLGVLSGLLMLGLLVSSLFLFRRRLRFVALSLLSLGLLGVQGWLGARVVGTFLAPYAINVHLVMALLIVGVMLFFDHLLGIEPALRNPEKSEPQLGPLQRGVLALILVATLVQMFLGVQVRVELETGEASTVIANLGGDFGSGAMFLHRICAMVLSVAIALFSTSIFARRRTQPQMAKLSAGMISLVVIQIMIGVTLEFMGMPAAAKPFHLLCASLLFGIEMRLVFQVLVKPRAISTR